MFMMFAWWRTVQNMCGLVCDPFFESNMHFDEKTFTPVSARHPQALFSSWPDKHNPGVHTMKNRNGIWSNHFFHPQWFLKKQDCTHYKQEKKPGLDWLGAIKKPPSSLCGFLNYSGTFLVLCWWKVYRKSLVRGFSLSHVYSKQWAEQARARQSLPPAHIWLCFETITLGLYSSAVEHERTGEISTF